MAGNMYTDKGHTHASMNKSQSVQAIPIINVINGMVCRCVQRNSFTNGYKFYTVVKRIFKLKFQSLVHRRSECMID